MALSKKAREAKNRYKRKWDQAHRDRINSYHKQWREKNKDKIKGYNEKFWEKKAEQMEGTLNNEVSGTVKIAGQKKCINCGALFIPKRSTAKYCSELCRKQYNRARARNKALTVNNR